MGSMTLGMLDRVDLQLLYRLPGTGQLALTNMICPAGVGSNPACDPSQAGGESPLGPVPGRR